MIPSQVGIVAYVVLLKYIGWTNTHYPLIIPAMANSFGVFWMSQYIKTAVPSEIMESARIDGASEYRIFFTIVSPLLTPALLTLLLLCFVGSWNNFFTPLIILNRSYLYTVPVGIFELKTLYKTDYAAQITALSMSLIPLTIIFIRTAKYFVSGVTAGSLKG
jgi:multiple sugar transport system permease protein/cellobiose transport system permease protein